MNYISGGLTETVRGRVINRSGSDYDEARAVFDAMHDRKPRAAIQCMDWADVMAPVAACRDAGLDDDGLVIDLAKMKNVRIDRNKQVARVRGRGEVE